MQNYPPIGTQHSSLSPSSPFSPPPIVTLSHHSHLPLYQPLDGGFTTTATSEDDPPSLILDGSVDDISTTTTTTTTFPSSPPAPDPLPLLFQGHRPASSSASSATYSSPSAGSIDFAATSSTSGGSDHSKNLRPRSASPRFGTSSPPGSSGGGGGGGFLRQKLLRPFSRSSREGSKRRLIASIMTNSGGGGGGGKVEGDTSHHHHHHHHHTNAAFDYESLDDIHADELISSSGTTMEPPTIPPLISSAAAAVEAASKKTPSVPAAKEDRMYEVNLHGSGHDEEVEVHHHHHNHSSSGHDQTDHQGHHHSSSSHDHPHHHPHHSHPHPHSHDDHQSSPVTFDEQQLLKLPHHCHDLSMERAQAEQARQAMTKLVIGLVLCLTFMLVELVGGWLSKSLAIFTDAAHLTSDLVSFLISLLAIYFGQRRPTRAMSFGYYRFEVLGVLLSVVSIWVLTGVLLYFACHRIVYQQFEIESTSMLVVSSIGLAMNLLMMVVLSGGLGSCARALAGFFCCRRGGGGDKEKQKKKSGSNVEGGGGGVHSHHHGHIQLGQQEEEVVAVPTTPKEEEEQSGGRSFDFEHGHGGGHEHSHHAHSHSHGFGGHGHSHMNMNVRAALLHIVGDIIQSVGVLVAALLIHFWPHLKLADPICTLIFGVIVFATTYRILADTLHILMEGFPRELPLQYEAVKGLLLDRLRSLGVTGVHSLHVWALTHGRNALMVHLIVGRRRKKKRRRGEVEVEEGEGEMMIDHSSAPNFEAIRVAAERVIRAELSIAQTTIQVEYAQREVMSGGGGGDVAEGGAGAGAAASAAAEVCDTCAGPKS